MEEKDVLCGDCVAEDDCRFTEDDLIQTMYGYALDVLTSYKERNGTELNVAQMICHTLLSQKKT